MMDGRVGAIRDHLDDAGLEQIPILSYAAKVASAFYGPFREAADSAPQFGDRRTYQMDGANLREAMREIDQDIAEGADMILMKPAMPYLDVIRAARERLDVPIGAYQVSGEYAMLQAAFAKGWLDRERAIMESLISIRRAGADFTVTYFAKEAARILGVTSEDLSAVPFRSRLSLPGRNSMRLSLNEKKPHTWHSLGPRTRKYGCLLWCWQMWDSTTAAGSNSVDPAQSF